ncbi:MAG TPA: hypothetical protein DCW66_08105 [Sphingobacterium sp.]|uniref:hypothetical protein n=1 Tax=Sphingobacterium multivorum TaxID=28454 RepID=UPI000E9041D2|nr:hypothetical protein [Sphingobacterium multivorum]HAU53132.1 hypothetical protein [Sphingobacterium sp.]
MMENNKTTAKKRIASALVDKSINVISSFDVNKVEELWKESRQMNYELKKLKIESDERIKIYSGKLQELRNTLETTFAERETGLSALYRNLEQAEKENDREKIMAILMLISGIIVKNPLNDFVKMTKALEFGNQDTLELDF